MPFHFPNPKELSLFIDNIMVELWGGDTYAKLKIFQYLDSEALRIVNICYERAKEVMQRFISW